MVVERLIPIWRSRRCCFGFSDDARFPLIERNARTTSRVLKWRRLPATNGPRARNVPRRPCREPNKPTERQVDHFPPPLILVKGSPGKSFYGPPVVCLPEPRPRALFQTVTVESVTASSLRGTKTDRQAPPPVNFDKVKPYQGGPGVAETRERLLSRSFVEEKMGIRTS